MQELQVSFSRSLAFWFKCQNLVLRPLSLFSHRCKKSDFPVICRNITDEVGTLPQWTCLWVSSFFFFCIVFPLRTVSLRHLIQKERTKQTHALPPFHTYLVGPAPVVSSANKLLSNCLYIIPRCFQWIKRHAKCMCLSASASNVVLTAICSGILLVPLSPATTLCFNSQLVGSKTDASRKLNSLMSPDSHLSVKTLCSLIFFAVSPVSSLTLFSLGTCRNRTNPVQCMLVVSLDSQELQEDGSWSMMTIKFIFLCRLKEKRLKELQIKWGSTVFLYVTSTVPFSFRKSNF